MTIVVEDGSIVSGANSYITVAEFKSWANDRGITYGTDAKITEQLHRSMDYFESLPFKGVKHTKDQALQFPRDDLYIDGYSIDSNEIPKEVKTALFELVKIEIDGDSRLDPSEREVLAEQVDSIRITYKDSQGMKRSTPALTQAIRKLIQPTTMVSRA
jgi:hypothetical protein